MPPPDPADTFTSVKHYRVDAKAGADPTNPMALNQRRNFLFIRNNGLNAGSFWFDQATNSGQAIPLGPAETWSPGSMKVPVERVFFQSTLGTVFAVIEGVMAGAQQGSGR